MATSQTYLPAGLCGVRRRFEHWRRNRKGLSRVPTSLWAAAVKMAGRFGVSRTAQVLGVNYNALRKKVERQAAAAPTDSKEIVDTGFLELTPPTRVGSCQWCPCGSREKPLLAGRWRRSQASDDQRAAGDAAEANVCR